MTFPVVSADSDHRLLSGNPSGCAEVSQLYDSLPKEGSKCQGVWKQARQRRAYLMPFALRHRPERSFRIHYALLALAAALMLGTVGFHLVEGWPLSDSFYVTVQTLTTVGYGICRLKAIGADSLRSSLC
jgi:hypothetical protein